MKWVKKIHFSFIIEHARVSASVFYDFCVSAHSYFNIPKLVLLQNRILSIVVITVSEAYSEHSQISKKEYVYKNS